MNTFMKANFRGKTVIVLDLMISNTGTFWAFVLDEEARKLEVVFPDMLSEVELIGLTATLPSGEEGGELNG
jgi:hypothetical protein